MFKSDISIAVKVAILIAFLSLLLLSLFVLSVSIVQLGALAKECLDSLSQFGFLSEESIAQRFMLMQSLCQRIKYVLFASIGLNLIMLVTVAMFFNGSIKNRLQLLIENTNRLEKKQGLLPEVGGKDEIGLLDKAFHKLVFALEQAIRRERAIVNNTNDVICSIDKCNKFLTISPACLHSWGYSIEEMLGKNLQDITVGNTISSSLPLKDKCQIQSSETLLELKIKRKDGQVLPTTWSVVWSEEEQAFFCVAHDLSEKRAKELLLKESTATVRLILESIPVGLVVIDHRGNIDLANSKIAHMYGAPLWELVGKHIRLLLADLNLTDSVALQLEKFADCSTESWMACANGKAVLVDIIFNEFMMHGQRKFLLSITEAREWREIERIRQELQLMLTENLNSPITSIRASLSMLATGTMGDLTESGNQLLRRAQDASDRLIALISDLLDIKQARPGRTQLELTPVLVSSIIQQTIDSTHYLAEQKGICVEIEGYEKDVYADEARIVQVLVNLVSNAIKFSPLGSTVRINVAEIPEWLEFRVTDEGKGIPKDLLDKVFEHTHITSSNGRRGYDKGTGLVLGKTIIERHDGIIGVESEEDHGSTFWFRLPHSTSL